MTDIISQFAARLAQVERQLARTSRTAQLAYSSIEGGAINVHDDDGGVRGVIGQQPDGTTGVVIVNGPPPPTPTAPVVEPALAGLKVTWDGEFTDAQVGPWTLPGPKYTFSPPPMLSRTYAGRLQLSKQDRALR